MNLRQPTKSDSGTISRHQRLILALAGVGLVASLGVARLLRPDSRGYGTHQQLGLPPCTFVVIFGRPCPTCGMTTAWSRLMHGDVRGAIEANIGGALLALAAVIAAPCLLWSAATGKTAGWRIHHGVLVGGAVILAVVTLLDWLRRLMG